MTWTPPAPPAWVEAANRGASIEHRPSPGPFAPDTLIDGASTRTGLPPDTAEALLQPLTLLCDELESTARLSPLGRWATQRHLDRLLDERLRLLHEPSPASPDDAPIIAPVFVVGPPRSGTTVMHRLLARSPRHRAPEGWEFLRPSAAASGHDEEATLRAAADELTFPQRAAGGLAEIHEYSARMPKECLSAMAFSFRSEEFVSRYSVPGYAAWLRSCDMAPAYELHRVVLRQLQADGPARRWVLKSPVHLQSMPTLLATYPDARLLVTHREPAEVLASVSSLIATLRSAFSEHVDPVAIGRHHLDLYADSLDRLVDHADGLFGDRPVVHLTHRAITEDPIGCVRRTHDRLDLGWTTETEAAMTAELAAARADAPGSHRYRLEDFGLSTVDIDKRFARYRSRFLEDR